MLETNYVNQVQIELKKNGKFVAINACLNDFSMGEKVKEKVRVSLWTRNHWINRLLVSGLNPGLMPGSVLDREFILKNGLLEFDQPINGVEDWMLWMRIIRSGGRIKSIKTPIYRYRIHETQFSSIKSRNSFYFGKARALSIEEAPTLFEKFLSLAEITYELKYFSSDPEYVRGLGGLPFYFRFFSLLRIFNIALRRFAKII
jgi:hypothetical protein